MRHVILTMNPALCLLSQKQVYVSCWKILRKGWNVINSPFVGLGREETVCLLKLNHSKVEYISPLVAVVLLPSVLLQQLFVLDCVWKHLNTSSLVWICLRPSVWSSRRAALHWLHIVKCLPSGQPPSLRSHLHCRSRQAWIWRSGFPGHVSCFGCPPPARSPLW